MYTICELGRASPAALECLVSEKPVGSSHTELHRAGVLSIVAGSAAMTALAKAVLGGL
jgi:hypothetical protein